MLTGQGGEGPGPSGLPDLRFQNEDCRDVTWNNRKAFHSRI